MSRKVVKSVGQRRRSPRISALDTSSKDNHHHHLHQKKGQHHHLNTGNALSPLSKSAKQVWKGRDGPENGDCVEWRSLKGDQKHDGDALTNGKGKGNGNGNGDASIMPAKHILELILDTLQRRDTYEIFGEPVDPDEVEDYYEIIKEPMDFGTMRAKLHEGMYQNLQQFQHDVFLIPENAMHFNSSSTTYFRQARAIHELANKVFHVLKTNPENVVSEFSGTRRRSMRKALSESIPPQCPSTSAFRTSNRKTPAAFHFGDGRVSNPRAADRRDTYLCNKDVEKEDPLHSTFYTTSKPLLLMHQGDISYEDSLMWYVKDLGATAQMITKRKLLRQHESTAKRRCGELKEFKTFRDFAPAGCNPFIKASNTIDLTQEDGEEAKLRHWRKEKTAGIPTPTPTPSANKVTTSNRNIVSVVRDLNCSSHPVILALENHHHRHHSEFKSRNKKSRSLSKEHHHDEAAQQQQQQKQKEKPLPSISHFTFDLFFLKARLDQMKAVNRKGGLSIYE